MKPFVVDEVLALIERALEKRNLVREVTYLRTELQRYEPFERMVGKTKAMKDIFSLISTISESDGAVLIQGESGTGKELVARAIHNRSSRAKQPFVVVNCAAIPKALMESEVFGHHKGAFTNATRTTSGKLEIAGNGTIFLDDIDTLDISMQAKLLRVIQEKEFERVGSTKTIKVNARFVAASNKDLEEMIIRGQFRDDLYYRLNVFPIKLPPLRDRRGDIPLLLNHFMELYAKRTGKPPKRFSKRIMEILMDGDWPGNVRELQNLVERLATTSKGIVIDLNDIPNFNICKKEMPNMTLREAVQNFEMQYICETLARVDGIKIKAAERLGIHRNTLLHKMNELGIK